MRKQCWILIFLLFSCNPQVPEVETLPQQITHACSRSFYPTLLAWESVFGRAPTQCQSLDKVYTVYMANTTDMAACKSLGSNQLTTGCTETILRTILLLKGRSQLQLVDSSIHEWIHVLAYCVFREADYEHVNPKLWEGYGSNTVEVLVHFHNVEIGSCL